jgi:PAS domain S-box-containing protein
LSTDRSTRKRRDESLWSLGKTREALFAVDSQQRIIYWNEGARKLLGYSEPDVLGKPCWRVIGGRRGNRLWCQKNCRIHRCVLRDQLPPHHYFEIPTKEGRNLWVGVSIFTLKVKGKPISAHLLTSVPRAERLRQTLHRMQGSVQIQKMVGSGPATTGAALPEKISGLRGVVDAHNLTRREIEVLALLAEGLSTHGIAGRAGISYFTARNHIQNGLRKIGMHSRAQAVSFAYSRSLI